ncbi:MAG TPA: DUF4214 domain-containing protein [Acidimicrobiales bacterium]|nr:DUF4214 domain-containing protein [Acidimicrobiales bacterium]
MVRLHRPVTPTSSHDPGRRRLAPLAASVAVALAVIGLVPVGGAGAAPTVTPVVLVSRPLDSISLPGTVSVSGSVTSTATMTGTLQVALYPPVPGPLAGHQCKNTPFNKKTTRLNGTLTGALTYSYTLPITATEGVWGVQASYSGDADNLAAVSRCESTLVLAPDTSWTPGQPSDDTWLPFRTPQALVDRQYRDFLGRAPTGEEQALWVTMLLAGQATPGDVVEALRETDDNVNRVDPVTRLYQAYFLRTPDAGGLDHWVATRRSGVSLIAISEHFAASTEFKNRYGALTNAAFVDLVYQNVLGRAGDKGGVTFWNQQLDGGKRSRGSVMAGFSESPEYRAAMRHQVDVAVLFAFMLERAPMPAELEAFVAMLALGPDASLPFTVASLAEELFEHGDYADRL